MSYNAAVIKYLLRQLKALFGSDDELLVSQATLDSNAVKVLVNFVTSDPPVVRNVGHDPMI